MRQTDVSAEERYQQLEIDRRPFLDRARLCAALTIPAILPREGHTKHSILPTPYQSLGARGVRTLASKLLLSMFPQVPFFNYKVDDQTLADLGEQRGEVEKALASRERSLIMEMENAVFKPKASMVFQHLLVTGNMLLYTPTDPQENVRNFRLDQYIVRRDPSGNVLEIIIKEEVDFSILDYELQQTLMREPQYSTEDPKGVKERPIELYTRVWWDASANNWKTYQEIGGFLVPDSEGTYPKDLNPYLPLRLITQPNEDYGRSYVEEYLGDLDSLEALSETLVEASAASARVVFLVSPNGTTNIQVVAKARNGDVVAGNANDVTAMQVQKQADLSVAQRQAEEIGTRLSYAFLLHAAIQRQGDRVTAEEIRYMATELDDALGGIYTLLASEFQLPIVALFEKRMEKNKKLPALPKDVAKPVIVTGLEAIGRGHDAQNMKAFVSEIVQIVGPDVAMRYLNPTEFMSRSAAAYSIDTTGLLKTEEQIQQAEQMAQVQQLIQHLGPNAINQMGAMAKEGVAGLTGASPDQVALPNQEDLQG